MRCTLVSPVLDAVVSVGMPGMLGMPGTKLGMLVAAGFSIFGGGGLRNVPTPPADQLGSLGGRGVPSSSSTRTFSHSASSVCALVSCPEAAAPGVFGGKGMVGGGRQIPPQPDLRGTGACDIFEHFTLGSVTFVCFEI